VVSFPPVSRISRTRRFITALTSVHHLSLSWASPIESIYPHSNSWRSILIVSTHLRLGLPSGLLPSGFPHFTNPKVDYRTHKRPPPVSTLGQPNPVHIPTFHLLEIRPNVRRSNKRNYREDFSSTQAFRNTFGRHF